MKNMNMKQLKKGLENGLINYPFKPVFPNMSEAEQKMVAYEKEMEQYEFLKSSLVLQIFEIFADEYKISNEAVARAWVFAKQQMPYDELYGTVLKLEETIECFNEMKTL